MIKIAFIGAGSVVFTRELLTDICSSPELAAATSRSTTSTRIVSPPPTRSPVGRPAHCTRRPLSRSHLDRREAVDGAQYVINMVQVGMHDATLVEFEIPKRVRPPANDRGLLRHRRHLSRATYIRGLLQTWRRHGDGGRRWRVAVNYTNPMAMNCWFTTRSTPMRNVVGLCHSVQHTTRHLADLGGRSLCGDRLRRCGHQPSGVDPAIDP